MVKPNEKIFHRWWFWLIVVIITGIIVTGCGSTDVEEPIEAENKKSEETTAKPTEEKKESVKKAESKPKDNKIEITQFAIDMAIDTVKGNSGVEDAAVSVKGDEISMALVVNSATTGEAAKEALDNFARSLTIRLDGKGPTKDYYGEVYDQYSVILTAVDSQDNEKAFGAMAKGTHRISW
ncbi:hypothetical protein [Bacillus sp. UMB0893]|uniref:hypothetical protein n=1 Tax=Bacillus sp. UMB0893 TaxID=2066053 RepID=UPI000C75DE30|nr:hypothetical protein [Bacillus sp. UMB0893]PLR65991.1 hypothetical protein CYJ36_20165 [Bacillus sp. UMB0893]